jgi:hypothetical protein
MKIYVGVNLQDFVMVINIYKFLAPIIDADLVTILSHFVVAD